MRRWASNAIIFLGIPAVVLALVATAYFWPPSTETVVHIDDFGADPRERFVPTPFPADDPRLRFEAEQLDAAQRVASPERFKEMFNAADARLQGRLSVDYDTIAGAWCVLYVGDWLALRAARFGEREDRESAIEHYQTLEETMGRWPEGTEEYRIVGAARAARKRIEARPPLAHR